MPDRADASESKEAAVEARMNDPTATTVEKVLAIVEGVAEGFAEQSRAGNLPRVAGEATQKAIETAQEVRSGVAEGPVSATTGVSAGAAGVQERTQATERAAGTVAQMAGLAARAPAAIAYETREAARKLGRDARKVAAAGAAAAAAGIFALLFLSWAIASGINVLIGSPWGELIVGILWLLVGLGAYARVQAGLKDARRDASHSVRAVRGELTKITEPMRESRRGRAQV